MATPIWDGNDAEDPTLYPTDGNYQEGTAPAGDDDVIFPDGCTNPVAGSNQSGTALASFTTKAGYSGAVGSSTDGKPAILRLAATTFILAGSGVSYIDLTQNSTSTCTVDAAGASPGAGEYGLALSSADTFSTLKINLAARQSVGVAALAAQVGTFTAITVTGAGDVVIGSGVTTSSLSISGSGTVRIRCDIADITITDGSPIIYLEESAAVSGTLFVLAGIVYNNSTGTIVLTEVSTGASVNCTQGTVQRVMTDITVRGEGIYDDSAKRTTITNAIKNYGKGTNIFLGSYNTLERGVIS